MLYLTYSIADYFIQMSFSVTCQVYTPLYTHIHVSTLHTYASIHVHIRYIGMQEPGYCQMFGTFCCKECNNTWHSENAWSDCGQRCRSCKKLIAPAELRPLRHEGGQRAKSESEAEGPLHQQALCNCVEPTTKKRCTLKRECSTFSNWMSNAYAWDPVSFDQDSYSEEDEADDRDEDYGHMDDFTSLDDSGEVDGIDRWDHKDLDSDESCVDTMHGIPTTRPGKP